MIEQIETVVKDYIWMKKEIERLERIIFGYSIPMKNWGVSQYGIESAMPKGSKGKSEEELKKMDIREERQYARLLKMRDRVYGLEAANDILLDDKERVIYDCMLDGMSYREIAHHVGISRNQVRETKESILNQLSQKSQLVQLLNLK